MKRIVLLAAIGGLFATGALAQPAVPSPANPAVKDPQANVSARPVAGANSFTRDQAQAQIEARGYSRVAGLVLDDKGVWRGTATREGRSGAVTLDFQGNVNLNLSHSRNNSMSKIITRVYPDYAAADLAIKDLKNAGLGDGDISILASNAEGWHRAKGGDVDPKHDKDRDGRDDRAEGAAAGAGIGALAGGAAGAAVGLGLIAVPGVGPVVAFGWLAALAAGALTAAAAGGIIGALVESGVSKENAEIYAEALRRGGAIVTARVPEDEEGKYMVMMDNSALDTRNLEASYRRAGWEGYDASAPSFTSEEARLERENYRR